VLFEKFGQHYLVYRAYITTGKMQVLVHAGLEGSVNEWQGFGRELSRTGVAGDCKSERSHKQR